MPTQINLSSEEESQLQQNIEKLEQARAIQEQIHELTSFCVEKCDVNLNGLNGKDKGCLVNCVGRFLDTAEYIAKSFPESAANLQ